MREGGKEERREGEREKNKGREKKPEAIKLRDSGRRAFSYFHLA